MKNLRFALAIMFFLSFLIQSCNKNNASQKIQTINATIKSDETYQYSLGSFGDEEGASITQQAVHYDTSKIDRNNALVFYRYKPMSNYTGTDEVEIKSERGSDGASRNNQISITKIKFTITN